MIRKAGWLLACLCILNLFIPAVAGAGDSWKENKVKIGDIKVRYLEAGAGDKIIVFLTGWTMPADVWMEQFPYFTARGFRVIAFDPRSQGQTTDTETGNTYQQHAADLYELLLSLKAEHSFLVGWSSGVLTLLEYISSPDSIRPNKIILVDGSPAAFKKDDYPGATTLSQVRSDFLKMQQDRKKFTEQFVQGLFKQPQPISLIKSLNKSSLKMPVGAAVSLFFDMVTGDRLPALARISVPTLIITTEEMRTVGEYMHAQINRSELNVIEDAGHAIFLDKPQAFNQAVETFIGEY